MYKKLIVFIIILIPLLSGCALFYDVRGDGDLRFARVDNTNYQLTGKQPIIDGCWLDINFNTNREFYSLTVFQYDLLACQTPIRYSIYPEVSEEYTAQNPLFAITLEGFDTFSWIVYENFSMYYVTATIKENTSIVAIIEKDVTE